MTSGRTHILFFNLEEQSWVLVSHDETIVKKVPDGVEYTPISDDLRIFNVMVNGYRYESGCPGIIFFADGSREYAEMEIENIKEGKRYLLKLNPYVVVPEIQSL